MAFTFGMFELPAEVASDLSWSIKLLGFPTLVHLT